MSADVDDPRIEALDRLGHVHNDVLRILIDHVRALTLTVGPAVAALGPDARVAVRDAALIGLGEGPDNARAAALIEALTREPAAALVEHQAGITAALADVPARLQ